MEYVFPILILVLLVSSLIFIAGNSLDENKKFIDIGIEFEGNFVQRNWELFKQSLADIPYRINRSFKKEPELKKRKRVPYDLGLYFKKEKELRHNGTIKNQHKELLKVLLGLDDKRLDELLELYKQEFGKGAARYARKTYRKWEKGEVKPIKQTFDRFMVHLPKIMDFDMKTEVLRHLMEAYCARDSHNLTVYTDDWEQTLEPLVKQVIEKPYNARLPKQIEERLRWLAYDDMDVARQLLAESKVQEGKIAVSMLRDEFENIEYLLENTKGKRKITHKLKFPYGTINLDIKRR